VRIDQHPLATRQLLQVAAQDHVVAGRADGACGVVDRLHLPTAVAAVGHDDTTVDAIAGSATAAAAIVPRTHRA
jgi:hypothetical protein